jgi:hypothetical protein
MASRHRAEVPGEFARGLFHSDGYRGVNREAPDQLGVPWWYSRPKTISVARREAVARLDEFVGAKY